MPLIGTAGHVDHGKSTLIQRITGRNPDRWEEEKRRGLTIDLGFAWATLPNGTEVSFVDVPGHERYLKNMLAGVEAIDVALFVVAADEGWMPQSEEHLAVLDLLGVERGVVALTKVDTVDDDLVELARSEVEERLMKTALANAPVHPVSGVTGQGVDELLDSLSTLVPSEDPDKGRPRLWADRSFSIAGAGTVVTGSLLAGSLSVDDRVEVYPQGIETRVRGLQSHEKSHDSVSPGRRVAVNLVGVDPDEIRRGDMLGLIGQWELSRRFTAKVTPARFVAAIEPKGAYQIHLGSSAHQVDIDTIKDDYALLRIGRDLPLAVGDRFILRDTGRRLVIGGGRVLDPAPGPTRRALTDAPSIDPDSTPDQIADRLLAIRRIDSVRRLTAHSGGGSALSALVVGDRVVEPGLVEELVARAVTLVETEHSARPLRDGLPIATLAERLGVEAGIAEAVVEGTDLLDRNGPDVALPGYQAGLDTAQEKAWRQARDRLAESLAVPDETDLGLDSEIVHLKLRQGDLVRISENLVYLPEQVSELTALMAGMGDSFTVADFRDAAGLSRKYAVPILEWSDKEGLTIRRGDIRSIR